MSVGQRDTDSKGERSKRSHTSHAIESWLNLAHLIDELSHAKTTWLFRGEPASTYELRPSGGREGEDAAARTLQYSPDQERAALRRFRHDAQPYVGFASHSDLEWLAIAQHHGMATRLLDWSESLLVAAFFAVQHAGSEGHALIYGVSGLPVLDPDKVHDPFAVREVSIYRPRHLNPRIAAQRSVFTVHPDPTQALSSDHLRRWTVSQSACRELKLTLDFCAVNYASLFPDLNGLARHVGWRYKWGLSQGPMP